MRNIWDLFIGDLKRIKQNTLTLVIIIGLVALPSIFSWYNMLASWNVFDNTGNLTVAVANTDEGYESDLIPLPINIGDRIESALRENDQLNWVFTTEEDAIDGARAGRYYAAVVIPKTFSADMLSFYSDDSTHATIDYYANEKKSAIAPKVTDQGADRVSAEINKTFAQTLTQTLLSIASAVSDYASTSDASGSIGQLSSHLRRTAGELDNMAALMGSYGEILSTAQSLTNDSAALLQQATSSADSVVATAQSAKASADSISGALDAAVQAASDAMAQSSSAYASVPTAIDNAFSSASTLSSDSASQLRSAASSVDAHAQRFSELSSQLSNLRSAIPTEHHAALDAAIGLMSAASQTQSDLAGSLRDAASDVETGNSDAQAKRAEAQQKAAEAKAAVDNAKATYDADLKPVLEELAQILADSSSSLSSAKATLDGAASSLVSDAGSISGKLGDAKTNLTTASEHLTQSATEIRTLADGIDTALASSDSSALMAVIGQDPTTLATAISAPVALERHAIYPAENFGSAMAPLYTTLALWIGALLAMVTLKVTPSARTIAELDNPTMAQLFVGRFGIVAFISLLQSTTVCLGNLFFLGVQAVHPLLYLLCFWISGLSFAFIIYTLVASFGNAGKALGVVLLIVQVSGGGGSFPLQLLPQFFQNISPFLPISHAVNAMRAAMFGLYGADYWIQLGTLILFTLPLVLIGLVLRNPIVKVVDKFVERVEKSRVM